MRCVIQRVARARVTVDGEVCGAIDEGLLVLFGVHARDTVRSAEYLYVCVYWYLRL
ncbi:MAG: D-aminoacyl-tRNA deacylase, partial [Candidatus Kapaibacterium sp.]